MIVKELDSLELGDKFEQAGYSAESQLAFYLKREFKDDPQIFVFNHLRLEKAGDACQIDHLVLHPYGIIIIESKSVTTRLEVNELGEWKRWFNNGWQGIPSPVLQAQRQSKFLKNYLEDHVEKLLNTMLFGKQAHFIKMPIDLFVAISDSGIINRPKNSKLDSVSKADQIPDKIKAIIAEYRKKDSLLSLTPPYAFDKNEIPKICEFFLTHHQPAKTKIASPEKSTPVITEKIELIPQKSISVSLNKIHKPEFKNKPVVKKININSQNTCSHCQNQNLSILYGHSYYFKCHNCNKNTAIKNICSQCGNPEKTRKSGLQFFTECQKCETSRLLHTNSSITTD
ncbi:MAG: hypothetical protein DCF12_05150 [Snowella sp.]|jgi:hypothetical protein|nr:MAG: hypothetical protein DCF12_05150 [Snowella sp.]